MQLTQQLGLMALASTASAFVVDVFSGERCTGQSQNVNVYDNTCAAWMIGYRSFRVKTYGSTPQRAPSLGYVRGVRPDGSLVP
ncbi:hypothetical protein VDGD_07236 [Verticillium dahliae]|nr:hypothetical protein VDGD_07236 [Verticillium dahliae]